MIFSIKVFVTLLDLKIARVAILRDLHVYKVLASSSWFLYNSIARQTVCPNPSPKPFSQSGKTVNFWPGQILGEGQVQLHQKYKEEPLSAILCLCVCLAGVSTCLHHLDQEKIALSRFSVSCVSVFGTGELSIPTVFTKFRKLPPIERF
jgi:hypothetical protein